eukprot:3899106-Pyramimonas_sp.AAC.4
MKKKTEIAVFLPYFRRTCIIFATVFGIRIGGSHRPLAHSTACMATGLDHRVRAMTAPRTMTARSAAVRPASASAAPEQPGSTLAASASPASLPERSLPSDASCGGILLS